MKGIKTIVILIAIGLVVGAVFAFQNFMNEESTEFGSWGQQIIFEFEDGSSEPLGGSLLSFIHEGKTVVGITYILSAKATGTGYNAIEIDLSNYVVSWIFTAGTTGGLCTWQDSAGSGGQTDEFIIKTIDVNSQWDDILNIGHSADSLIAPLGYGFYTFNIKPAGSIRYRADGEIWVDVPLPSKMSADVEVKDDRTLVVDFDQGSYYESETDDAWMWDLEYIGDDWTEITFTQEQIDCCTSDTPVDVFSSIDSYWDFVFEDGTWKNFWYNQADPSMNGGTLQHIQPGIVYFIHVTQDCTLIINKC